MAQIMAVGVRPSDQDTVFLDDAETRRSLAGSGEGAFPALGAESGDEAG